MSYVAATTTRDQNLAERLARFFNDQHAQLRVQLCTTNRSEKTGGSTACDNNIPFGIHVVIINCPSGMNSLESARHSGRDENRIWILPYFLLEKNKVMPPDCFFVTLSHQRFPKITSQCKDQTPDLPALLDTVTPVHATRRIDTVDRILRRHRHR